MLIAVFYTADRLLQYDEHLTQLERKISLVQERALEQAETDSLGTWHLDEEMQEQEHMQVTEILQHSLWN